jgi:hypothetical protein
MRTYQKHKPAGILVLVIAQFLPVFGGGQYNDSQNRAFLSLLKEAQSARKMDNMPQYEKLLRAASRLRRLDEWDVRALSWCVRRQGRPEEAIEIAKRNIEWYPCPESYGDLADCYADSGDFAAGRAALKALSIKFPSGLSNPIARGVFERICIKRFDFSWDIDVPTQRKQQPRGPIFLPLPFTNRPYQTAENKVTGGSTRIATVGENTFLEVSAETKGRILLQTRLNLIPVSYRRQALNAGWSFPESTNRYLRPSGGIDPNDPAVQELKPKLKAATYYQSLLNVLQWVNKNVKVITTGDAGGNTSQVFQRGGGHCESRANMAVALLRACGIPARMVRGNAFILEKNDISWHTVTEFYLPEVGWVTWDYGNTPLVSMQLGYVATFSYGGNNRDSALHEAECLGPAKFQRQSLTCDFVKGKLVAKSLD